MNDDHPAPPTLPLPSAELFAYAIGIQGWLLTLSEAQRVEAIATLRRVVAQTVETAPTIVPLWPRDLRSAVERRLQEAGAWWNRTLDEAES
jgi:hypothetical protein